MATYPCFNSPKSKAKPSFEELLNVLQVQASASNDHQHDQSPPSNQDQAAQMGDDNKEINKDIKSSNKGFEKKDDKGNGKIIGLVGGSNNKLMNKNKSKSRKKINVEIKGVRKSSSLNNKAITAHLANIGLPLIPFLTAFSSLKVVNLSDNCIERINHGALPKGLHVLNLSRNRICVIEGLQELICLRILDLSYNKISIIGGGLANCRVLKELYLAGNRVTEVQGLHRLSKLANLDLRFNKICTTKCLDQLGANEKSLVAISLEGNPAHKNVGDNQLRKYLQLQLPNLVYFNPPSRKTNSLKDCGGVHCFDLSLRSDHKSSRKVSIGM